MQTKTSNSFFFLLLPFTSISFLIFINPIASDPQTYLINKGCSQYNVTNPSSFFTNLNATFSDIRSQLINSSTFATASRLRATDPVYVLFQCRDYLSSADCLSCFSTAELLIRNCSAANGARVIYDGCFLRYESNGVPYYFKKNMPTVWNPTLAFTNDTKGWPLFRATEGSD